MTIEDIIVDTQKQSVSFFNQDNLQVAKNREILKSLSGSPDSESVARFLVGADSLTATRKMNIEEIRESIIFYYDSYNKTDYKNNGFAWLDNVKKEFAIFEESSKSTLLLQNKFIGFKRLIFSEEFIMNHVRLTWEDIKDKVCNNKLVEEIRKTSDGKEIINKNGIVTTQINFPKSKDYSVFVRGTGKDSSNKPIIVNGIKMYYQNIWVKGSVLVNMLSTVDYI